MRRFGDSALRLALVGFAVSLKGALMLPILLEGVWSSNSGSESAV